MDSIALTPPASSQPVSPPTAHGSVADTPDRALTERCQAGDLEAFDVLVGRHQDRIFSVCYWILGSRDEAADAAQEAFVRAFRSLKNFRGESTFSTWLHRIAVNSAIDASQRRKRAPLPYTDLAPRETGSGQEHQEDPEPAAGEKPSQSDDPAQTAMRGERRQAVRAALAHLPDHYRAVLVLFDIEGYSYEEISESLQLPLGTVKSRLNRARQSLRDRLQDARELFDE